MREISGRTLFTAIFGDPVEHSMSPAMHNAAYAALGSERAYLAFHVTPERLPDAIHAIPALGIAGVNLTVPHKENALRMMAHLSDEAIALGAINCVVNREGELQGDNTDARGLELDLRECGVQLEGRQVMVVGAGGAAASAVLACIRLQATKILVCNRTPERASRLARRFTRELIKLQRGSPGLPLTAPDRHEARRRLPRPGPAADSAKPATATEPSEIRAGGLELLSEPAILADTALVINATPMGLKTGGFTEVAYDGSPADCVFYDMVYGREPTPFLASALARGRRALDGAGMLINQGALAFELFNQLPAPAAVMRAALMEALGRTS